MALTKLHAVIGVWHRGPLTYYVKRSPNMQNYPGIWSLLSCKYQPREIENPEDLTSAQVLMERMSKQRLDGVPIKVLDHLISGDSQKNPYELDVYLHLYSIELSREPKLNPHYYTEGAWLNADEYERRSAGQECGLCLRLWSDYAWLARITDRPFAPQYHSDVR